MLTHDNYGNHTYTYTDDTGNVIHRMWNLNSKGYLNKDKNISESVTIWCNDISMWKTTPEGENIDIFKESPHLKTQYHYTDTKKGIKQFKKVTKLIKSLKNGKS